MRTRSARRSVALALTALLALTACGGGNGDGGDDAASSGSASASPSPTPRAVLLTEAELQARLLTLEDLPTGFVVSEPVDPTAEEEEPGLTSSDPTCQAYLDSADSESTAPSAAVAEFENPDSLEFITEDLESYEGDAAQSSFAEARTSLAACRTLTLEGAEGEITVQQQSFGADLGDEVMAVRMDGEVDLGDGELLPFSGNIVAVRLENNVVAVTIFAIGGQLVDTEEVVRTAVRKFQAGEGGAGSASPSSSASARASASASS